MAQKDFLKNLKNAVDNGEFNSEAANKINEIAKKAENFSNRDVSEIEEDLKDKMKDNGGLKESVSENELPELNSEYEQKMNEFKLLDKINSEIVTLTNMDDFLMNQHTEMANFIDVLKKKYDGVKGEHPELKILKEKMSELEKKYNLNVNINKK